MFMSTMPNKTWITYYIFEKPLLKYKGLITNCYFCAHGINLTIFESLELYCIFFYDWFFFIPFVFNSHLPDAVQCLVHCLSLRQTSEFLELNLTFPCFFYVYMKILSITRVRSHTNCRSRTTESTWVAYEHIRYEHWILLVR